MGTSASIFLPAVIVLWMPILPNRFAATRFFYYYYENGRIASPSLVAHHAMGWTAHRLWMDGHWWRRSNKHIIVKCRQSINQISTIMTSTTRHSAFLLCPFSSSKWFFCNAFINRNSMAALFVHFSNRHLKSLRICWPNTIYALPSRRNWSRTLAWPKKLRTTTLCWSYWRNREQEVSEVALWFNFLWLEM